MDKARREELRHCVKLIHTGDFDPVALGRLTEDDVLDLLELPRGTTCKITARKVRPCPGRPADVQPGEPCEKMHVWVEDLHTVDYLTTTKANRERFTAHTGLLAYAQLTELEEESRLFLKQHVMGILHNDIHINAGFRRGMITWMVPNKNNFATLADTDLPASPYDVTEAVVRAAVQEAEDRTHTRSPQAHHQQNQVPAQAAPARRQPTATTASSQTTRARSPQAKPIAEPTPASIS